MLSNNGVYQKTVQSSPVQSHLLHLLVADHAAAPLPVHGDVAALQGELLQNLSQELHRAVLPAHVEPLSGPKGQVEDPDEVVGAHGRQGVVPGVGQLPNEEVVEVSQVAGVGRPRGGLVDLGRGIVSEQSVTCTEETRIILRERHR